jgi:hypothetical protein
MRMFISPARRNLTARPLRWNRRTRGQIIVPALVFIFIFMLVAVALIDVYQVHEARSWGYRVAQQAALAGTAGNYTSSKWVIYQPTATAVINTPTPGPASECEQGVMVELNEPEARAAAVQMLQFEMEGVRGFPPPPAGYDYDIQVLPDFNGGMTPNWPLPAYRRLGASGDWSSQYPAVAVALHFRAYTFLSSIVGRTYVDIYVFAAAEISQPPVCP